MYVQSSVEGVCTEFGGRCMYRVRWKVYVLSSVEGVCTEFGGRCMYRVRW